MITFKDVKDSNPVVIFYPAGIGGETIVSIISDNCDTVSKCIVHIDEEKNRRTVGTPLSYVAAMKYADGSDNDLHKPYTKQFNSLRGRALLKEHPIDSTLEYYSNYLPNSHIVYISPVKRIRYFSELTFAKLTSKVTTPIVSDYIKMNFGILDEDVISHVVKSVNKYDWVYNHEIETYLTNLTDGVEFQHTDDLNFYIKSHCEYLLKCHNYYRPKFKETFEKFTYINADNLTDISKSHYVFKMIGSVIPIEINNSVVNINRWINKNNKLLGIDNVRK